MKKRHEMLDNLTWAQIRLNITILSIFEMKNNWIQIKTYEQEKRKSQNLESNTLQRPPRQRCRQSPAKDEAPPSSGRNCMPPSPLSPTRELSAGISPFRRGDGNTERLPPGYTTSKGSMNLCFIKQLFLLCRGKESPWSADDEIWQQGWPPPSEVATVRHAIIILLGLFNWHSHHWNTAVVCYPGPPSKCRSTGRGSGSILGPLHSPGTARDASLFMMLGCAQGRYFMARTIPLSWWYDDEGGRHTTSRSQPLTAMTNYLHQVRGQVQPGTKESRSRSHSSSPEDLTRHTQQHYRILLQKASC
jgi:hypothetical protein